MPPCPLATGRPHITTQSCVRKCPGRPLYKNPSTTLLTSSKGLLDPDPAAKHLVLDCSPLRSSKASICNPRPNVVILFYSSSTKHPFLHLSCHSFTRLSEGQVGKEGSAENSGELGKARNERGEEPPCSGLPGNPADSRVSHSFTLRRCGCEELSALH